MSLASCLIGIVTDYSTAAFLNSVANSTAKVSAKMRLQDLRSAATNLECKTAMLVKLHWAMHLGHSERAELAAHS
eukprot:4363644-Amphidinium_carterae.1